MNSLQFFGRHTAGPLRCLSSGHCLHVCSVGLIFLYLWPYWALGRDAYVMVHDQLDSMFISIKTLAESGLLFAHPDAIVPQIGNEIPRGAYPSPFYAVVWLFMLFGAFEGFVASQVIIRLVAYWGMFRLLSQHFLTEEELRIPAALSAVLFACLPHYALFGLSIAGQPLFFSGLSAIRAGRGRLLDWLICGLYPVGSLLALGGLFTMVIGGLLWLLDVVTRHPGARRLFLALVFTLVSALIVEYQMVMTLLGMAEGFVSHRVEFEQSIPTVREALASAWNNFQLGQYHSPSMQEKVIVPASLFALALAALGRDGLLRRRTYERRRLLPSAVTVAAAASAALLLSLNLTGRPFAASSSILGVLIPIAGLILICGPSTGPRKTAHHAIALLVWSLSAALVVSFWYGLWPSVWGLISTAHPRLPYLNLSRFHYLHPMLWTLALAAIVAIVWLQGRVVAKLIATLIVVLHALTLIEGAEHRLSRAGGDLTFREFFSSDLFKDLAQRLESEGAVTGVISVGLHPAIAAYNGFHTLDGYLANYPLAYKQTFRQIIEKELSRSDVYRNYFDKWGSRFYVFSHELAPVGDIAFSLTKQRVVAADIQLRSLRLNMPVFVEMGGSHVLSALPIGNAEELGLELVTVAGHAGSPWEIYAYRVAPLISK